MDKARLIAAQLLKQDEGVRQFAYKDTKGYWTIGVGRNIDQRTGRGISPDEIDYMLQNDISENIPIARKEVPTFDTLSDNRKAVLISMVHQMGSIYSFKKFRAAIVNKDWAEAKRQGLESSWARNDSPERAKRLMDMFLKG